MKDRPPLRVFITVDTEFWPSVPLDRNRFDADYERDVLGRTRSGEYGLKFQLDLLKAHGLKAVFLVEALSDRAVGPSFLRRTVDLIQAYQQDVQLHLHTEWLAWMEDSPLPPGRIGQHLHSFSVDEQTILLADACQNLRGAGARDLCGFRAGNYSANMATLRALANVGIRIDTSYNYPFIRLGQCRMESEVPFTQATVVDGIREYPISFFEDWPGHYRHLQICACSAREMRVALLNAWETGWQDVVIVSHSFELIKWPAPVENSLVVRRLAHLCRFLERENDRFQTADFRDAVARQLAPTTHSIISGHLRNTVERYAQQVVARLI